LISAFESNRASFVNITTEKREAYQDRHCSKQLPSSRDLKRATYLCSLAAHPQDFDICFHGPASSYPTSKSFTGLVLGHPRGISNASAYLFDFTSSYRENKTCACFGSFLAPISSPGPNRIAGDSMRFRTSMCLAALFLVFFTIAAWSTPLTAQTAAGALQPTPDNQ